MTTIAIDAKTWLRDKFWWRGKPAMVNEGAISYDAIQNNR